jgi:hypothetical protein
MMAISFKGAHFPKDIILMGVRWYVAYPLSYRHVEELLEERGVPVDHATIQRWVVKYSPLLEEAFHRRKRSVWVSWRMDETYIKVKGQCIGKYLSGLHKLDHIIAFKAGFEAQLRASCLAIPFGMRALSMTRQIRDGRLQRGIQTSDVTSLQSLDQLA